VVNADGAWRTQLEGRVGMKIRKWVGNADFATRAILGGASGQHRGAGLRGGAGGEKLEHKIKKVQKHKHAGFECKGNEEAVDKRLQKSNQEFLY